MARKRTIIPNMNGSRVQLSPATDAWMMGDRYGVIIGSGHTRDGKPFYRVKMDVSKKVRKVPLDLLDINPRKKRNRFDDFAPSVDTRVKNNRDVSKYIGRKFKIQGRPTMVFRVVADKTVAGFHKLWGITLDNKYSTVVGVKEAHFID